MSIYLFNGEAKVFVLTVDGWELYLTKVTAPAVLEFVTNSNVTFGDDAPCVALIIVDVFAGIETELFEKDALAEDETP